MQVNNQTAASQILNGINPQSLTNNQGANSARAPVVKDDKSVARQDRLDIDENALALVEQQQSLKANPQTLQSSNTGYDQPSRQNQTAVATYQSVDNQIQREQVKNTFGVDLFA